MKRNQIVSLFFIGLLLFIVWQVILILSPFADPIFWGATLAFGFYPVFNAIRRRLHPHEKIAALLTTFLIFVTFVPMLAFIVASVFHEAIRFQEWLSTAIRNGTVTDFIERVRNYRFVAGIEDYLLRWDFIRNNVKNWIGESASSAAVMAASQVGPFTKSVVLGPLNFFLMFFLVFFFLKDGGRIYGFIYEITPLEERIKKDAFKRVTETFEAVIRGQILTALAQALTAGIIFWILGLPLPVFFAACTFMAALVPVLGAPLVWVPLVIYLLVINAYVKAVILLLLGVFLISLLDNFLKPVLIGEKTKLPYLLLFLGILGGLQVYGLMGMFLAPAVLSLFFVLIRIYQESYE